MNSEQSILTKKVQRREKDMKYGNAIQLPHFSLSGSISFSFIFGLMQWIGAFGRSSLFVDKAIMISCQASPVQNE